MNARQAIVFSQAALVAAVAAVPSAALSADAPADAAAPVAEAESVELPESAEEGAPSRFSLRVGPAWSFGAKISGHWDPASVRRMVSASYGSTSVRNSVPSATGYADHDYIDGYVHLDEGTTNPRTMEYGTTWNWGYDHSSQYNGSTVSFHSGAAGSTTSVKALDAAPMEDSEDVDFLGVDVQGRLRLCELLRGEAGLAFGVRWFDGEKVDFDHSAAIVRESRSTYRFVDVYDAHWEGFPSAPYANDVTGPGYLLDNQPMYRAKEPTGRSSSTWMARSRADVEMDKLDLRLGLPLGWRLASWLGVELQPQVLVSRVELSADVESTVSAGKSTKLHRIDHGEKDDWIWGAGVEVAITADISHGWFLAASGAWDAWFDDLKVSAGPYDIKAELGEWTVALAIGKEF